MSDMLNRRFIPCHLLLNWNISAFSTCWNGLDQHKMDKLYRGWKHSDWRSWKKSKCIWSRRLWRGFIWCFKTSPIRILHLGKEFFKNSSRILQEADWYNKVHENSEFFFFFATNDKFLSSVQDQIYVSKSISWMKCLDWISSSKYFWLENDFEKVWTWINAFFSLHNKVIIFSFGTDVCIVYYQKKFRGHHFNKFTLWSSLDP